MMATLSTGNPWSERCSTVRSASWYVSYATTGLRGCSVIAQSFLPVCTAAPDTPQTLEPGGSTPPPGRSKNDGARPPASTKRTFRASWYSLRDVVEEGHCHRSRPQGQERSHGRQSGQEHVPAPFRPGRPSSVGPSRTAPHDRAEELPTAPVRPRIPQAAGTPPSPVRPPGRE